MFTHKKLKSLYLLLLVLCPSHIYPMDLSLKNEGVIVEIQGYPSDLQCTIFESMLSQLSTYQTTFFEDNQI